MDAGKQPIDGALERFLSSAIAAILTIIFSWKILLDAPLESPASLVHVGRPHVAQEGRENMEDTDAAPEPPSPAREEKQAEQGNEKEAEQGRDQETEPVNDPSDNNGTENNRMLNLQLPRKFSDSMDNINTENYDDEATLTPSSPLNLETLTSDLDSPREGAISRFGMRQDDDLETYIQEYGEAVLLDRDDPSNPPDSGPGLVSPSSQVSACLNSAGGWETDCHTANIDQAQPGEPHCRHVPHEQGKAALILDHIGSPTPVTPADDELFLLSGVEVSSRLPRRIQQRFLEVLASRGQLPLNQELGFRYDLESGGVSLDDNTVIGSLEEFLLEEGCLDSSESEFEEDWLNRTLDTITEEDSDDLESSSADDDKVNDYVGCNTPTIAPHYERRSSLSAQRPLVCLTKVDRTMEERDGSGGSGGPLSDSGSLSSDLEEGALGASARSLYTPVCPPRHVTIGPYVDRTSQFARNRHLYMQARLAELQNTPPTLTPAEGAGPHLTGGQTMLPGDMVDDCDNAPENTQTLGAGDSNEQTDAETAARDADTLNAKTNADSQSAGDNCYGDGQRPGGLGNHGNEAEGQVCIQIGEDENNTEAGPPVTGESIIKSVPELAYTNSGGCTPAASSSQDTGPAQPSVVVGLNDMQRPSDTTGSGCSEVGGQDGSWAPGHTAVGLYREHTASAAGVPGNTAQHHQQQQQQQQQRPLNAADQQGLHVAGGVVLEQVCVCADGRITKENQDNNDDDVISGQVESSQDTGYSDTVTGTESIAALPGGYTTHELADHSRNKGTAAPLANSSGIITIINGQANEEEAIYGSDHLKEGRDAGSDAGWESPEGAITLSGRSPVAEVSFRTPGCNQGVACHGESDPTATSQGTSGEEIIDKGEISALQGVQPGVGDNTAMYGAQGPAKPFLHKTLADETAMSGQDASSSGVVSSGESWTIQEKYIFKFPAKKGNEKSGSVGPRFNVSTQVAQSPAEGQSKIKDYNNESYSAINPPLSLGSNMADKGDLEVVDTSKTQDKSKSALRPTRPAPPRPKVPPPSAPSGPPPRPQESPGQGKMSSPTRPQDSPNRPKPSSPPRPQGPPSPKRSPARPKLGPSQAANGLKSSSPASVETYEIQHRRAVIPHDKGSQALDPQPDTQGSQALDPQPDTQGSQALDPQPDTQSQLTATHGSNNQWETSTAGQQSSLNVRPNINSPQTSIYNYNKGDIQQAAEEQVPKWAGSDKQVGVERSVLRQPATVAVSRSGQVLVTHPSVQSDPNRSVDRYRDSRVVRATATSTALAKREPLFGEGKGLVDTETVVSAVASAEVESENPYIAVARASARAATVATASAAQTVATSHAKYPKYDGANKDIAVVISTSCVINGSDDATVVQETKGVLQSIGKGVNVSVQTRPRAPISDASTQSSPDQKRKLRITIEQPDKRRREVRTMECELPEQAAQNEIQSLINTAVKKMLEEEVGNHTSSLTWDSGLEESIINRVTEQVVSAYSERTKPYRNETYDLVDLDLKEVPQPPEGLPPWKSRRAPLSPSQRDRFTQESNTQASIQYFYVTDPDKDPDGSLGLEPVLQVVDNNSYPVSKETVKTPPARPKTSPSHGAKELRGRQSRPRERGVKTELSFTPSYNRGVKQKPVSVTDGVQLSPYSPIIASSSDTINSTESESKGKERRRKKKRKTKRSDVPEKSSGEKKLKGILKKPKDKSPELLTGDVGENSTQVGEGRPSRASEARDIDKQGESIPVAAQPNTADSSRTGVNRPAPAATHRKPKEYHSVLQEPVKDDRTPFHILQKFGVEKVTPESRAKIDRCRQQFYEGQSVSQTGQDTVDSRRERPKSGPPRIKPFLVDINLEDTYQVSKVKIDPDELRKKLASARPVAPNTSYVDKVWNASELIAARSQEIGLNLSGDDSCIRTRRDSPSPSEGFEPSSKDGVFRRARSLSSVDPNRFFSDRTSRTSLIETDLDTGKVRETPLVCETDVDDLVPSKSKSLTNLQDKELTTVSIRDDGLEKHTSMVALPTQSKVNEQKFALFKDDDKNKSESELRISRSLNKLSLPDWYTSSQWHSQELLALPNTKSPGLTIPEPPSMDRIDPDLPKGTSDRPVVIQHWMSPTMLYSSPSNSRQSSPMPQSVPVGFELPSSQMRMKQKSQSYSTIPLKDFEEVKTKLPPKKSPERPAKEAYLKLREQSKSRETLEDRAGEVTQVRPRPHPARIVYTDFDTEESPLHHVPIIKDPGSSRKQVVSPTVAVPARAPSQPSAPSQGPTTAPQPDTSTQPSAEPATVHLTKPAKKKKSAGKKTKKSSKASAETEDGSAAADTTTKKTKKKSKTKKEKKSKSDETVLDPVRPEPLAPLESPRQSVLEGGEGPISTSSPQLAARTTVLSGSAVVGGSKGQVEPEAASTNMTSGYTCSDNQSDSARGSSLMESSSGSPTAVQCTAGYTYPYSESVPQHSYSLTESVKAAPQYSYRHTEGVKAAPQYSYSNTEGVKAAPQHSYSHTETVKAGPQYSQSYTESVKAEPQSYTNDSVKRSSKGSYKESYNPYEDVSASAQPAYSQGYVPQGVKTVPGYTHSHPLQSAKPAPQSTPSGVKTVPQYATIGVKVLPPYSDRYAPQNRTSGAQQTGVKAVSPQYTQADVHTPQYPQEYTETHLDDPSQPSEHVSDNKPVKTRKKKKQSKMKSTEVPAEETQVQPVMDNGVPMEQNHRPYSGLDYYGPTVAQHQQGRDRPVSYPMASGNPAGPKYYTDTQPRAQYYTDYAIPHKHTHAQVEPIYVNVNPKYQQRSTGAAILDYCEEPRGAYRNKPSKSCPTSNGVSVSEPASLEEVLDGLLALPSPSSASSIATSPLLPNETPMDRAFRLLRQASTPQGSYASLNMTAENLNNSKLSPIKFAPLPLQARDAAGDSGEITVKCRNTRCGACTDLKEAREYYKTCHNCYTYYCSRECRKAHWPRHKSKCLFSRVNSMCKYVIKKIHDDPELGAEITRIAQTGYLSRGRGCIMFVFSSPDGADKFLKKGWDALVTPPVYVTVKEIEASDLFGEQLFELTDMCKSYNPEIKYVLEVAIIAGWEVPSKSVNRKEGPAIKKCVKLRLTSNQSRYTPQPKQDADTLILTAVPGDEFTENLDGKKAREICFVNIQRQLRQRGVSLRHDFPDVYNRLCKYVSDNEHFTPITLFPMDGQTRKRFMCLIMPNTEPDIEWMDRPDLLDELGLTGSV